MSKDRYPFLIVFEGKHFEEGFGTDIVAEDKVIVELKSVEKPILLIRSNF